ncbi:hypothetical protein BX600DRAFT_463222 [Xylariales sp. PMI_506]|nr:hypothetical protein BX600DRAFT_463222 [Xylariales sp. PMI_506]
MSLTQCSVPPNSRDKAAAVASLETPKPVSEQSHRSYSNYDDTGILNEFADMDAECMATDSAIISSKALEKEEAIAPPALPERSRLRESRVLDNLKLQLIESATQALTTPHDVYLSDEEASSSADDFSDYDFDYESSSEESEKGHFRRRSYEDTARVVSVIYSGKPSLVDLPSPRRSISSHASSLAMEVDQHSDKFETLSASSLYLGEIGAVRNGSVSSTISLSTRRPSFLRIDPFAASTYSVDETNETLVANITPQTPKTPTAMLNRVQRTFSLARKRSRPIIQPARNISTVSIQLDGSPYPDEPQAGISNQVVVAESPRSPVRYSDIIRVAKRNTKNRSVTLPQLPAISPVSPLMAKKGLLNGLSMNKRRGWRP